MSHVLIVSHVLAWSLIRPALLTVEVRSLLENGATIHVPPCSLREITSKVRKGKWDDMAPFADRLDSMCAAQGFIIACRTGKMAALSRVMDWDHAEPSGTVSAVLLAFAGSLPVPANHDEHIAIGAGGAIASPAQVIPARKLLSRYSGIAQSCESQGIFFLT